MGAGSASTHVTARFLGPDVLERGRPNTLTCPLWASGAVVQASAGTITIYDRSGAVVVTATLTGLPGTASYTYTPPSTLQRSLGWRVEWVLTIAGVERVFQNDAALARVTLAPVITDVDLYRRASSLDPSRAHCIHSETTFQDKIDEAFATIQTRLLQDSRRPHLIISASALRQVEIELTLGMIYEDFGQRLNEAYRQIAVDFYAAYEREWGRLSFVYDPSDDGAPANAARQKVAPLVFLCGAD